MKQMKSKSDHRRVLIISPQASRIGHGALHGQRTLAAFAKLDEWETVFLTGHGFRERIGNWPLYGQVIEGAEDSSAIGGYRGSLQAIRWGLHRRKLQDRFLQWMNLSLPGELTLCWF
jgi:hypothetical protein